MQGIAEVYIHVLSVSDHGTKLDRPCIRVCIALYMWKGLISPRALRGLFVFFFVSSQRMHERLAFCGMVYATASSLCTPMSGVE